MRRREARGNRAGGPPQVGTHPTDSTTRNWLNLTTYLPTYSTARRDHAALVRTLESPVPLDVQVGTPFLFYYCSYSLSLTSRHAAGRAGAARQAGGRPLVRHQHRYSQRRAQVAAAAAAAGSGSGK